MGTETLKVHVQLLADGSALIGETRLSARELDKLRDASDNAGNGFQNLDRVSGRLGTSLGGMATQAASTIAAMAGIGAASHAWLEFDTATRNTANLTGAALGEIKQLSMETAVEFGRSASEIAGSIGKIGSKVPALLETPSALQAVANASLTLADAADATGDSLSDMEASLAVTAYLSQWGVAVGDAERAAMDFANAAAEGAKLGSASITDLTEVMENSGTVFAGAGRSREEFVAVTQVLAERQIEAAEAGTALRNVISILLAEGDKFEKFGIDAGSVNPKLNDMATALGNLEPLLANDVALVEIFGRENLTAAQVLIEGAESVGVLTEKLTGTQTASEQARAGLASATRQIEIFQNSITNLSAMVIEAIVGDNVAASLAEVNEGLQYLQQNSELIETAMGVATVAAAMLAARGLGPVVQSTGAAVIKSAEYRAALALSAAASKSVALAEARDAATRASSQAQIAAAALATAKAEQSAALAANANSAQRLTMERQVAAATVANTAAQNALAGANARVATASQAASVAGRAQSAAMGVLAGTARAASGALSLIGGPAGAAMLAATALTAFVMRSKESKTSASALRGEIDALATSFRTMGAAQLAAAQLDIESDMRSLEGEAQAAGNAIESLTRQTRYLSTHMDKGTNREKYRAAQDELTRAYARREAAVQKLGDREKLLSEMQQRQQELVSEKIQKQNESNDSIDNGVVIVQEYKKSVDEALVSMAHEVNMLGMSANQQKLYQLEIAGANESQIEAARLMLGTMDAHQAAQEVAKSHAKSLSEVAQEAQQAQERVTSLIQQANYDLAVAGMTAMEQKTFEFEQAALAAGITEGEALDRAVAGYQEKLLAIQATESAAEGEKAIAALERELELLGLTAEERARAEQMSQYENLNADQQQHIEGLLDAIDAQKALNQEAAEMERAYAAAIGRVSGHFQQFLGDVANGKQSIGQSISGLLGNLASEESKGGGVSKAMEGLGGLEGVLGDLSGALSSGGALDGLGSIATDLGFDLGGLGDQLGGLGGQLDGFVGKIGGWGTVISAGQGIMAAFNGDTETAGATLGSLAGSAFGPLGSMVGGQLGGMLGGMIAGETRSGQRIEVQTLESGEVVAEKIKGPSGGSIAEDEVNRAIQGMVSSTNQLLEDLGSSAEIMRSIAQLESSQSGKGGAFFAGQLRGDFGQRDFGEMAAFAQGGAGGALKAAGMGNFSPEEALAAFQEQLAQASVEAVQAATDTRAHIQMMLADVDATMLSGDEANRLLARVEAVNAAVTKMEDFGLQADHVSEAMVNGAGGADQFAAGASVFTEFLGGAEHETAMVARALGEMREELTSSFTELGLAVPQTTTDFKTLALGIDTSTEAGQRLYGQVIGLAPQFLESAAAMERVSQSMFGIDANVLADVAMNALKSGENVGDALANTFRAKIETGIMDQAVTMASQTMMSAIQPFVSEVAMASLNIGQAGAGAATNIQAGSVSGAGAMQQGGAGAGAAIQFSGAEFKARISEAAQQAGAQLKAYAEVLKTDEYQEGMALVMDTMREFGGVVETQFAPIMAATIPPVREVATEAKSVATEADKAAEALQKLKGDFADWTGEMAVTAGIQKTTTQQLVEFAQASGISSQTAATFFANLDFESAQALAQSVGIDLADGMSATTEAVKILEKSEEDLAKQTEKADEALEKLKGDFSDWTGEMAVAAGLQQTATQQLVEFAQASGISSQTAATFFANLDFESAQALAQSMGVDLADGMSAVDAAISVLAKSEEDLASERVKQAAAMEGFRAGIARDYLGVPDLSQQILQLQRGMGLSTQAAAELIAGLPDEAISRYASALGVSEDALMGFVESALSAADDFERAIPKWRSEVAGVVSDTPELSEKFVNLASGMGMSAQAAADWLVALDPIQIIEFSEALGEDVSVAMSEATEAVRVLRDEAEDFTSFRTSLADVASGLTGDDLELTKITEQFPVLQGVVLDTRDGIRDFAADLERMTDGEFTAYAQSVGASTDELRDSAMRYIEIQNRHVDALEEAAEAERKLAEERRKAARELNAGYLNEITRSDMGGVELELLDLEQWAADNRAQAREVGADLLLIDEVIAIRRRDIQARYAEESNQALAEQVSTLQDSLRGNLESFADTALGQLEQSVSTQQDVIGRQLDSELDALRTAHDARMESLGEERDAAADRLQSISRIADQVRNALDDIRLEGFDSERASFRQGQSSLTSMLATARAGGELDADALGKALSAVSGDSRQFFSTEAEYIADTAKTAKLVGDLADVTGDQVTVEEKTLAALESQMEGEQSRHDVAISAAESRHEAEMERLQGLLDAGQAQINAALGIDTRVVSVVEAQAKVEDVSRLISEAQNAGVDLQAEANNLAASQIEQQLAQHAELVAQQQASTAANQAGFAQVADSVGAAFQGMQAKIQEMQVQQAQAQAQAQAQVQAAMAAAATPGGVVTTASGEFGAGQNIFSEMAANGATEQEIFEAEKRYSEQMLGLDGTNQAYHEKRSNGYVPLSETSIGSFSGDAEDTPSYQRDGWILSGFEDAAYSAVNTNLTANDISGAVNDILSASDDFNAGVLEIYQTATEAGVGLAQLSESLGIDQADAKSYLRDAGVPGFGIPQLAEGGIVMPRPGGVLANIAEAGKPEAVIPLDKGFPGLGGGVDISELISVLVQEMREIRQEIVAGRQGNAQRMERILDLLDDFDREGILERAA